MNEAATQEVLPLGEDKRERKTRTGIWPAQRIKAEVATGAIKGSEPLRPDQIQPASLDLRLGNVAHLVAASFLPGPDHKVADKVRLYAEKEIDLRNGAVLKKGNVYIIPLLETLSLKSRMSGVANPKSSTGRLDVFARLITDHGTEFDTIRERYSGPLWLEVAPRSFNVMVRKGSRLAQVRLRDGNPGWSQAAAERLDRISPLVHAGDGPADIKQGAIALSVDISGDRVSGLIGYKARKTSEVIDVDKVNHYDPDIFWRRVHKPEQGGLILDTDEFHILATRERVAVPPDHAADMVAYDTLVGEFRAHYAGFFDPGFGYAGSRPVGTTIVLEVRSHEVPFLIEDGQIVGRMEVERLSETTDRPYGSDVGSSYQSQGLTLSKHFKL